jgi:hypothetical protein
MVVLKVFFELLASVVVEGDVNHEGILPDNSLGEEPS